MIRETRVCTVKPSAPLDSPVHRDLKDCKDILEQQALKETKAFLDLLGLMEALVITVLLG